MWKDQGLREGPAEAMAALPTTVWLMPVCLRQPLFTGGCIFINIHGLAIAACAPPLPYYK